MRAENLSIIFNVFMYFINKDKTKLQDKLYATGAFIDIALSAFHTNASL